MKTILYLVSSAILAFTVAACTTPSAPVAITTSEQTIANAVEDAVSIGLVPVLSKNPSYIPAAQAASSALSVFDGGNITPDSVAAFLSKTTLAPQDQRVVAGVVVAAWQTFQKRYAAQVGAQTRPDVKIFLTAVASGISNAVASVPSS